VGDIKVGSIVMDRNDNIGRRLVPRGEGRITFIYPNPRFVKVKWGDGSITERTIEHVQLVERAS